jgi:DNA-binding CsgD family transcriptional regulator
MDGDGWPLVGRVAELERIATAYREKAGVVLVGAAGVGKTRLAREAVQRAGDRLVAWATGTRSAATIPLGALAHLLMDGGARPADLSAPLDALGSLVATFAARPEPRPVLVVDDVHLLDDASAALVHHMAVRGHAFVLLTARTGDAVPDAVTALWTGESVTRVDVAALSAPDVTALLMAVLQGRLDAVSEQTLWHACGGNPMLLREMLQAGRATGALRQHGQVWRWTGTDYVTARLTDFVQARLGALEPGLRAVVEVLACAEPLHMPLLEAVAEHAAVVEAERRGVLVTERVGDRVVARLPHPVYADVVCATMPHSRERGIWRALVAALEQTPTRRSDDALYAAQWRLQAGMGAEPELLLTAARSARERLDLDLAERLARAASRAGAGALADLALAELLVDKGRYEEAASALPSDDRDLDEATRARWLSLRHQIRYWGANRDFDPATDSGAEAMRSWLLLFDGQSAQALDVGLTALAMPGLGPADADRAASTVIAAYGLLGRHEHAMAALDLGLTVARRTQQRHPWGITIVAGSGSLALIAAGRLRPAAELADRHYHEAVRAAAELGPAADPLVGTWAVHRGVIAKSQGDAKLAVAALTEAATLLDDWRTFRLTRLYLSELAGAAALAGDVDAAWEWLKLADGHADAPGCLFDAWIERNRSWVTAAAGDLTTAAAQAREAAALARSTGQPTIEAYALFDAARFGTAGRVHRRLATLAREIGGALVPIFARVATAWHTNDNDGVLDQAPKEFAQLGQLLYAAETAMTARAAHTRTGDRGRAQAALLRATELASACDGARTALLQPADLSAVLTARERQVADLAAAGHSSPMIASRLGLSVRTVNNHLSRAYAKLGIAGRGQLGDLLSSTRP